MYCAICGSAPPFAGYSNRSASRSVSSATSAPSTGTSRPASIVSTTSLILSSAAAATGRPSSSIGSWRKSAPELGRTLGRRLYSRLLDETREALEVELLRLDPQLVPGRLRDDHVRAQQLPKLGDEVLQRGSRGSRRLLAPERVDDPVGRD